MDVITELEHDSLKIERGQRGGVGWSFHIYDRENKGLKALINDAKILNDNLKTIFKDDLNP